MSHIEVPVLVIGAGPVGLMSAILLANAGHGVLVVERRDGPQQAPAAHVVNARSLEICRQAGVDMNAIAAIATDPADGGQVHFVTRLNGEKLGSLPFEQQGDDCLQHTPTPLRNISQHHFEPVLAGTLADLPSAELRYGLEWLRSEQDDDGVTSWLRDASSGEETRVRSRFVIAADGAGSRTRHSLGIAMQGPERLQSFIMIHFGANLRPLVKDRPGVLYWLLEPGVGQALIAHDIEREWVLMQSFDSDVEGPADFDVARCEAMVQEAIGEAVPVQILHRSPWHMSAQVADRMRERRIFLAGDAAHRFPPTGGLGLNSGVQDAHDLAWKLDAVLEGWGSEALLDSYEAERLPVARNNAAQSLKNASKLAMLSAALGLNEERTAARMAATLADPDGRKRVEDAIAAQAEHFDMLGLQIGFHYERGALVPEASEPPAVANPVREYRATTRPGARLPHAWVGCDGFERRSTLDLVATRGFTLISQGEHDAWAMAVASIARDAQRPIRHVRAGVDFDDARAHWVSVCELEDGGAVLVRPDQHVAWRSVARPDDPGEALQRALERILEG